MVPVTPHPFAMTTAVQDVYDLMESHSTAGFEFLEREDTHRLRQLIQQALESRHVEPLVDFFWNHDLVDTTIFRNEDEEHRWEKSLCTLHVDLDYLIKGECSLLTPKAQAYILREREAEKKEHQMAMEPESEEVSAPFQ